MAPLPHLPPTASPASARDAGKFAATAAPAGRTALNDRLRIGVYDSGIGGLSVLPALARHLPQAEWLYVADSAYAPYGERPVAQILSRARHVASTLRGFGANALVMACNTATAAAADGLRAENPGWPIIGIEPAVKPAALSTSSGHVGVMATQATLESPRFRRLLDDHGSHVQVHVRACHGLAAAIEACPPDDARVRMLLRQHVTPLLAAGCDVIVLGCTHYALVSDWIREMAGDGVAVLDTADPVARHTAHLMQAPGAAPMHPTHAPTTPSTRWTAPLSLQAWTSGPTEQLDRLMSHWLGLKGHANALPSDGATPAAEAAPSSALQPHQPLESP